jgi:hypothetical protein
MRHAETGSEGEAEEEDDDCDGCRESVRVATAEEEQRESQWLREKEEGEAGVTAVGGSVMKNGSGRMMCSGGGCGDAVPGGAEEGQTKSCFVCVVRDSEAGAAGRKTGTMCVDRGGLRRNCFFCGVRVNPTALAGGG